MIIRNRRKRERLLRKLKRPFSRIMPPPGHRKVISPIDFQAEIEKEIFRANRRQVNPDFAIISLDFSDRIPDKQLDGLIEAIQTRLRVSDTLGWHELKLAALLPETGLEGGTLVANSLVELAAEFGVELQATVSVYPWDDQLIGDFGDVGRQLMSSNDSGQTSDRFDTPHVNPDDWSADSKPEFLKSSPYRGETTNHFDGDGNVAMLAPPVAQATTKELVRSTGSGHRISFSPSDKTPQWKRAIDIIGASCGIVLLSPILVGSAAAVRLSSPGPVFFHQEREGKDGKVFKILKFRTMVVDAENMKDELRSQSEQDGPAFKLAHDPRITKVGRYLRKSCVDELPQLFNVLAGDMSIVGPRPLPVNESQQCLPWQRQRLSVLPGLTCIWQARGGRNVKFSEWMRMDIEYIHQRGFWYDLRLIVETAAIVVLHRGSV